MPHEKNGVDAHEALYSPINNRLVERLLGWCECVSQHGDGGVVWRRPSVRRGWG
jgi:hypothetical protein